MGRVIASLSLADGSVHAVYKHRTYLGAPIDMKQSDDGKSLLFYKYKADNRMLHLLDLENNVLKCVIGSVFDYDFLSDDKVIHALSSGLKIYHIDEKKNTIPLKDASTLSKRYGNSPFIAPISEILNTKEHIISKGLSAPHVFCGRIYFEVSILRSDKSRLCQWCSVNKEFLDFQVHCDIPFSGINLYIYGDASKPVFVFHCFLSEEKQWGCCVCDGNRQYKLLGYAPTALT
jgi:hypothetical protein